MFSPAIYPFTDETFIAYISREIISCVERLRKILVKLADK
jgi:hypothetical protein